MSAVRIRHRPRCKIQNPKPEIGILNLDFLVAKQYHKVLQVFETAFRIFANAQQYCTVFRVFLVGQPYRKILRFSDLVFRISDFLYRGRSSVWLERQPVTLEVAGSSPVGPAIDS